MARTKFAGYRRLTQQFFWPRPASVRIHYSGHEMAVRARGQRRLKPLEPSIGYAFVDCCRALKSQWRSTTLRRELLIFKSPLYSMNPSFRNLFLKKFTRERVVPTISASVSCDTLGSVR